MNKMLRSMSAVLVLASVSASVARADSYDDTIHNFKQAGKSGTFFAKSYGYAVFPTVGGGGFIIGGAHGKGRVYAQGVLTGDTTVNLLSAGLQVGAKAYSEIIFFEDKRALDEFKSGTFEFGAGASAVAITAGAQVNASTDGLSAGASGEEYHARDTGVYEKGMAVFTIAKGGLMYAAAIAGQRFSYKPRGA